MTIAYAVYGTQNGGIRKFGRAPTEAHALLQVGSGEALYLGVADDAEHYIDPQDGTRHDKQSMSVSVTTSTGQATITGVPNPSTLVWRGEEVFIDDGEVTVSFDAPGTYKLRLEQSPQHFDHEFEVTIP